MRLSRRRVVQHGVAVRERASLRVLPREADRDTLLEERREGERLGLAPVDPAFPERLTPPLELARELRVHLEAVGHAEQLLVEGAQALGRNGRHDRVASMGQRAGLRTRLGRRECRPQLVVSGSKHLERTVEKRPDLRFGDHAFRDETGGVRLPDRRLLLDLLRLERLRVRGLVLLVVSESPVADKVDHEVVAELLAVGEGEPRRREGCLGVVCIHVDDGDVEAFREVARVARGASFRRIGREADLVVRDDVQRAARRVAVERVEVEGLRDDALARE